LSLLLVLSSTVALASDDLAATDELYSIGLVSIGNGVIDITHLKAAPGTVVTVYATPVTGNAFYTWTSDSDSVQFVDPYCAQTSFVMPASNIIIRATFIQQAIVDSAGGNNSSGTKTHLITFNTQGGSYIERIFVADGAIATEPTPPTCDGYVFAGWSTDAYGENPFTFYGTPITDSFELYAQWIPAASVSQFTDLENHAWAKDAISRLVARRIINGTSATTYAPGKNITRADFITLVVRAFGFRADFDSNFSDVPAGAYYYNAVGIAKDLGIATGSGNDKFNPTAPITRQDIMVIIDRATKEAGITLKSVTYPEFADEGDVSDYAKEAVKLLTQAEIITGAGDKINPKSNATRAEVAVILDRLLNK